MAEPFTGKSGNFTKLEDTIRSFEELCDGKWDHLPEGAFMYVGPIEEAAAAYEEAGEEGGREVTHGRHSTDQNRPCSPPSIA